MKSDEPITLPCPFLRSVVLCWENCSDENTKDGNSKNTMAVMIIRCVSAEILSVYLILPEVNEAGKVRICEPNNFQAFGITATKY